ncbi:transmembrane protein 272-like isoform X1 [Labrus mixtus]|uniref:transmembrane protein 272-like isoform X1 n=2 Tax=Labrus mixtus TaxID=508554 RepID=UPI0029C0D29B|nr:transmembrane protein 272-like isoform X1 [Labrus mixtus]XP_060886917.1 transmembrane protein 272-like isoform X1 [Labrus mixtus]XP_060886918.1 transmembrane protein 272-like isoform X1 [Labrus mixtus]
MSNEGHFRADTLCFFSFEQNMAESLQHIRRPPKPHAPISSCFQAIVCVLPFAQLLIGAKYQFDCPAQRYIPIYLLVAGVVTLLLAMLSICPCTAGFGNHSKTWSCFVSVFFFCWFIAGNVWIYSIYEPNYNKTAPINTYCNKTLYLFAFWTTNANYILLGLLLVSSCCRCILSGDD